MIRLFRWLVFGDGHAHKWKRVDEFRMVESIGKPPYGTKYVCECEMCGKITWFIV
jgi:hypothetical protein